jgi:ATP/maltotriose-dependent transcriptional regulator MalT
VQEATGINAAPYGSLILSAWLGNDPAETKRLIDETLREVTARGEGIGITVSEYSRAVLCNALGDYEQALAAASRATEDRREMVAYNWGLAELVEAASRTARMDIATEAVDRLAAKARASGTEWALGMEARSRALISDDSRAEGMYRSAIDHLGRTRVQSELARSHLLYAEWLRRANRRVDARSELNAAHEMFASLGMAGFAERARRELVATGAKVRKRTVETGNDLSPQEAQIADLARQGFSNVEIGAQLFLSARTVEWHMSKILSKLGLTSRRQLRQALPG